MNTTNVFEIRSLLQNAQSVLVALAEVNDEDVVAAGLALYLTLTKMRKQVTVVAAQPVKVELSHLFGIDKISDKIAGGNNLVVSMPYEEGTIEKVSYHIENNRFNLVIEPRGESLKFDPAQVEYTYGRGDYDAVFVLGAQDLSALGELYNRHKNIFTQKPVINIDKSAENRKFGRINMVDDVPISQSVTQLVKDLRLPIDQDAASNLYTGIMTTFGSATIDALDPRSLDVLSFLGRMRAQNLHKKIGDQPHQDEKKVQVEEVAPSGNTNSTNGMQDNQTPEDWLKPKIFSSRQGGN